MPGIVPVGVSTYISASATAANVTYGPNISNTFRISNLGTNAAYVAVYNSGEAGYLTALDSTTGFIFTNNSDTGTIYASVIKYIGT